MLYKYSQFLVFMEMVAFSFLFFDPPIIGASKDFVYSYVFKVPIMGIDMPSGEKVFFTRLKKKQRFSIASKHACWVSQKRKEKKKALPCLFHIKHLKWIPTPLQPIQIHSLKLSTTSGFPFHHLTLSQNIKLI